MRLVGRLRHLREPNAFWTYLRRTIVNLATSHFRHGRVERAYLARLATAPATDTNDNDELDETMHRVLLGLPQRQRAAIVLRSGPVPADLPTPTPTEAIPPTDGETVRGWPDTSRNPPGVYSWDGARCASQYCVMGFMHNGYGSGEVDIRIVQVPEGGITDGATAATVAGHEGIYRRIDAQREELIVDIEGTTIAIRLNVRPGASQADLAEAHAIIGSMRTEPRGNDLGFRVVFTLTTDEWDSG